MRFEAGDEIRFSVQVKGSATASTGLYLRLYAHHGELPAGKTHVSHNASASSVFVQEDDSGVTNWVENGALSTSYVSYQQTYTATTTGFVSLVVLNWQGNLNHNVFVRNPDIAIIKVNDADKLGGIASSTYMRKDNDTNLSGHISGKTTSRHGLEPPQTFASSMTELTTISEITTIPLEIFIFKARTHRVVMKPFFTCTAMPRKRISGFSMMDRRLQEP